MKIRNDFVTNSSSSSFIIAYKDNNTTPIKAFPQMVEFILESTGEYHQTEKADIIRDIDSYNKYFCDRYGYSDGQTVQDIIGDNSELQETYDTAIGYLNDGYMIAVKRVDNWDDNILALIREMDDDENFIILEDDEY